jgi:TRAP-type C4-dicarboxylate transport system substrate-binding protein
MPLKSVDDMKGKKLGVLGGYFGDWVGAVGAVPLSSGAAERYLQLKDGVIDGSFLPTDMMYGFKHYEVADYYLATRVGAQVSVNMVINLDTWNGLSAATQDVFIKAAEEAEDRYITELVSSLDGYIDKLEAEGVAISYMTEEERAKWASLVPDTPSKWVEDIEAKGLPGLEIAKRYSELCKEKGYVWPREFLTTQ